MELAAEQSDRAPSRADFSTLSSSQSWRQCAAQPTAKQSCQAPWRSLACSDTARPCLDNPQHPSKHPGSGQTGLSPASQRPAAVGALTTLGAVFRAHGSRRRLPAASGSLGAVPSQLKRRFPLATFGSEQARREEESRTVGTETSRSKQSSKRG